MEGWIIFFLIVSFFLWIWISNYIDKVKAKAVEDAEKEFNVGQKIDDIKNILNLYKYFTGFNSIPPDYDDYVTDKSIGHCPKCNKGYLRIAKTFTGMDTVYNRYPTYDKYLKCTECDYTENYFNLKRRRGNTKLDNSIQFKNDFIKAYTIK